MKRVIGRHKAFLAAFRKCASITAAAKAAKVERSQHYIWLRERPGYREAFVEACEEAAQVLEDEAVRRAYKGVFEPNVFQGEFVYPRTRRRNKETGKWETVTSRKPLGVLKYSDSLLMFLMRGLMPQKYRDRVSAEVTGTNGGPIPLEQKRLAVLTDDELSLLISVAKKLSSAAPDGSGSQTPAA